MTLRLWARRIGLVVVGLAWLGLVSPGVRAQTAPVIQWTHDGTNVTHFQIVIGTTGTWVVDAGLPTPSGTTYEYALPALPAGQWQVKVRACYGADCQDSAAMTVVKMVPAGATALNYYWVSQAGTKTTWADCKSDTPLNGADACTLATANANADDGMVVWLRSGDTPYAEAIEPAKSGSSGSRITFAAHPNETPTFTVTDTDERYAVRLIGRDYVTVRGITSEASYAFFLIAYGADHNELAYSTFNNSTGMYSQGIVQGHNTAFTDMVPSTHNWLHHNTFSRYGKITSDWDDSGTIRINSSYASGLYDSSSSTTFEDNVFFYGAHDCLDVGGMYNVVRNNVFHNEEAYFAAVYVTGVTGEADTDTLTKAGHGKDTNDVVYLRDLVGGTGLTERGYYVVNATDDTLQVSLGYGGEAVNFTVDVESVTLAPENTPASGYFGNRNILLSNDGESVSAAFHTLVEGNRSGHTGMAADDDGSFGIENAGVHTLIRHNFVYNTAGSGIYFKQQPAIYICGGASTGDAETDIITCTSHGSTDGSVVFYYSKSGGTGLSLDTPYFVINATTNTFQLAATTGGAAIDFTTNITAGTIIRSYKMNGVTCEADDDTCTYAAHAFYADTPVRFAEMTGGTGLSVSTVYYVVSATANTFQLAATPRGAAIDITSDVSTSTLVNTRIKKSGNWGKVYHNTVYNTGIGDPDISIGFKYGIQVVATTYTPAKPWPVGVTITGNIVYDWTTAEYALPTMPSGDVTYSGNYNTDPVFDSVDISDPTSLTNPTLQLTAKSTGAIDAAAPLTYANGAGASSTTLVVDDAMFFQDGSWGASISAVVGDVIAVGAVSNTAQITAIDYQTHTITLAAALSWDDNAAVHLVRDSWGRTVLVGAAPDYGAHEYGAGTAAAPTSVVVR